MQHKTRTSSRAGASNRVRCWTAGHATALKASDLDLSSSHGLEGRVRASPTADRTTRAHRVAHREPRRDRARRAGPRTGTDGGDGRDRRRQDDDRRSDRAARRWSRRCDDGARRRRRGAGRRPVRVRSTRRRARNRSRADAGGAGRRPVAGVRRRAAGDGRLARRDRRTGSSTCTASTPTRACSAAATQRAALDHYGQVDLEPLRAARARGRPRSTPSWRRSEVTNGRGRARSTCCATRSTSSTRRRSTSADEDAALDREEAVLADAVAHREAGAAALAALAADGGGRDALGAALGGARRSGAVRRRSPTGCATCSPSSTTSRPSCGRWPRRSTRIPSGSRRSARAASAARPVPQVRRRSRRGDGVPRDAPDSASPSWSSFEQRAAELDAERARRGRREREAAPSGRRAPRASRRTASRRARSRSGCGSWRWATPRSPSRSASRADDHPGDRVQFLLAANPGAPLLPLSQRGVGWRAGPGDAGAASRAHRRRDDRPHAGVRRGRRRDRRHRRGRRRPRRSPSSAPTTRCSSSPTSPRSRRRRRPRSP